MNIKSELAFPELFPVPEFNEPGVEIVIRDVPFHENEQVAHTGTTFFINKFSYKLVVVGVASYWAEKGNLIIVDPATNAEYNKVRLFCLSNVFAAILYQREKIPLHTSAFRNNEHLVLIGGNSGVGKSTIVTSLLAKGFNIFSDDVCVPRLDQHHEVSMHASYPMIKLWKDVLPNFSFLGDPHVQLRNDLDKYGFYFHNNFELQPIRPCVVFFIEKTDKEIGVSITEIKGYQFFEYLESIIYRSEYLGIHELKQRHFELISSLANQMTGYVIKRPENFDSINLVTDLIVKTIRSENDNEEIHTK